MNIPKIFTVIRNADESGVSGTGRILDGILFHNGKVVICWRTDIDGSKHGDSSVGVYDSFGAFKRIHIDSHPNNKTQLIFNPDREELLEEIAEFLVNGEIDEFPTNMLKPEHNEEMATRIQAAAYVRSLKEKN